jgi:hypothetical protein
MARFRPHILALSWKGREQSKSAEPAQELLLPQGEKESTSSAASTGRQR